MLPKNPSRIPIQPCPIKTLKNKSPSSVITNPIRLPTIMYNKIVNKKQLENQTMLQPHTRTNPQPAIKVTQQKSKPREEKSNQARPESTAQSLPPWHDTGQATTVPKSHHPRPKTHLPHSRVLSHSQFISVSRTIVCVCVWEEGRRRGEMEREGRFCERIREERNKIKKRKKVEGSRACGWGRGKEKERDSGTCVQLWVIEKR